MFLIEEKSEGGNSALYLESGVKAFFNPKLQEFKNLKNESGIKLYKGLEGEFKCQVLSGRPRVFERLGKFDFLDSNFLVLSVDADIYNLQDDSFNLVRTILRTPSPKFPAISLLVNPTIVISLSEGMNISIGRSPDSILHLDSSLVSNDHARIFLLDGSLYIEDLLSRNGTFINEKRIQSITKISSGDIINISKEYFISPILNSDDLLNLSIKQDEAITVETEKKEYPCLFSTSEFVRPSRVSLLERPRLVIGRHPASDVWINSPDISREHCEIRYYSNDNIVLKDFSENGTICDMFIVNNGEERRISKLPCQINLGNSIIFYIVSSFEEELGFSGQDFNREKMIPKVSVGEWKGKNIKRVERQKKWEDFKRNYSSETISLGRQRVREILSGVLEKQAIEDTKEWSQTILKLVIIMGLLLALIAFLI